MYSVIASPDGSLGIGTFGRNRLLLLLCVLLRMKLAGCVAHCQDELLLHSHSSCLDCIPLRIAGATIHWHRVKDDCRPETVSINLHIFENAHAKCGRHNILSCSCGKSYASNLHERQHSPERAVRLGERYVMSPTIIFHPASFTQHLPPSIFHPALLSIEI